ncbi:T9SS type A sorting domain-containing protein [Flavobacterium panici]|uniref:Ycf48-like protein n=1 Tax=Flavobacterium panici TaxID=2654843 RepID=A0A9N8IYL0_9FLAO|nr:T9SS type A sorting domain-containing protein [Flavobacterium panici]CAC9972864.1 Ycf48-like protein [Flavobacterium panici]
MKQIYLFYLFLIANAVLAQNTWKPKYTFQDNFSTSEVFFVTSEKGFVGGFSNDAKASLYYTANGGTTWTEIFKKNNVKFQLTSLFFINENLGWAIQGSDLYKTVNNGGVWSKITINFTQNGSLKKLFFKDQNNGILTTSKGILVTTDGGATWSLEQFFDNSNNLLVFGNYSIDRATGKGYAIVNDKFIYETANYGINWTQVFTMPATAITPKAYKFTKIDYRGVAVGDYLYNIFGTDEYDGTTFVKTDDVWQKVPNNFLRFNPAASFSNDLFFGYTEGKIYNAVTKEVSYTLPSDFIADFSFIDNIGYAIGVQSIYKYDASVLSTEKFDYNKNLIIRNTDNKTIVFNTTISEPVSYSIYDISGKLISKENNILLDNKTVNFKNTGVYLVKITHSQNVISRKVLIN